MFTGDTRQLRQLRWSGPISITTNKSGDPLSDCPSLQSNGISTPIECIGDLALFSTRRSAKRFAFCGSFEVMWDAACYAGALTSGQ